MDGGLIYQSDIDNYCSTSFFTSSLQYFKYYKIDNIKTFLTTACLTELPYGCVAIKTDYHVISLTTEVYNITCEGYYSNSIGSLYPYAFFSKNSSNYPFAHNVLPLGFIRTLMLDPLYLTEITKVYLLNEWGSDGLLYEGIDVFNAFMFVKYPDEVCVHSATALFNLHFNSDNINWSRAIVTQNTQKFVSRSFTELHCAPTLSKLEKHLHFQLVYKDSVAKVHRFKNLTTYYGNWKFLFYVKSVNRNNSRAMCTNGTHFSFSRVCTPGNYSHLIATTTHGYGKPGWLRRLLYSVWDIVTDVFRGVVSGSFSWLSFRIDRLLIFALSYFVHDLTDNHFLAFSVLSFAFII